MHKESKECDGCFNISFFPDMKSKKKIKKDWNFCIIYIL